MSKSYATRALARTVMSGFWTIAVLLSFPAISIMGGYNGTLGVVALVTLIVAFALVGLLFVFNLTKVVSHAKKMEGAFWGWLRHFDAPMVNTITGGIFSVITFLGVVGYLFAQPFILATGIVTAPAQIMFFALAALLTAIVFIADSSFFEDVSLTRAEAPDIDDEAVLRFAERMERAQARAERRSRADVEDAPVVDDTLVLEDTVEPQNDPDATTAEIPVVPEPKPIHPW